MVPTQVRRGELHRDFIEQMENRGAHAIASAIGPARLWSHVGRVAVNGFAEGLTDARDAAAEEQLAHSLHLARIRVTTACERLVERTLPDITLCGLHIRDYKVNVVAAGACRVYVHRVGATKRLTPRDEITTGVLRSAALRSSMQLQPGDIVLAGTPNAFSDKAIAQLSATLDGAPITNVATLARILTEPAHRAGIGAAAVVIRIS